MNLYFTVEFRTFPGLFSTSIGLRTCSSLICNASVQFQKKIRKISRRRSCSPKYPKLGHFTLSFYRGRQRNVQRIHNARAQLLFCSLNLLFCGVLVAVAVVVCLRSLILLMSALLSAKEWPKFGAYFNTRLKATHHGMITIAFLLGKYTPWSLQVLNHIQTSLLLPC